MIDIDSIFGAGEVKQNNKLEYGISLSNDLEEWIARFNKHLEILNRSKNTISSYSFTLNALIDYSYGYMSDKKGLCDIDDTNVNDFLYWMENYETNRKYGSVKERISIVADFLSFSKNINEDFIDTRDRYVNQHNTNLDKINFALSEFEDYYFENELPLVKIDNNYIINYITNIPKASISTMSNRRAIVHKFFSFIVEETGTDCFKDLFRKMKTYKKQKGNVRDKHQKISKEKMKRFMDLLSGYVKDPSVIQKRVRANSQRVAYRDTAMILLMYRAGLRASEAINVRLQDIREENNSYRINVIGGKGGKSRVTYIKKICFEKHYLYFKEILDDEQDYLSGTSGKQKMDRRTLYINVKKIFNALEAKDRKNGVHEDAAKGLHIFRHLFGSEFAEENGNIKILQDLLGHSTINTTMIYSSTREDAKREAVSSY